jgi:hypothetical protein
MFISEFLKKREGFHFKDVDTGIKYRINKGLLEFLDNNIWKIDNDFGEDETYTDEIIEVIKIIEVLNDKEV